MKNRLIVLGTGTASSSIYHSFDHRHSSGYLLQFNNKNILIDCSEAIRYRLDHLKIDFFNIENIIISHFHPDHFDLETLVQAIFVRARNTNTKKTLTIYGPKLIEKVFSQIWDLKHFPGAYKTFLLKTLNIKFIELKNNLEINLNNDMSFTSFNVFHQGGLMNCYAFKFKLPNTIFGYSGDSGYCEGLIQAAKHTDFFICEAGSNIGQDTSETIGHLNPFQVGQFGVESKTKQLILTHYQGKNSPNEMIADVKKSGFKGKIIVAKDYQSIYL